MIEVIQNLRPFISESDPPPFPKYPEDEHLESPNRLAPLPYHRMKFFLYRIGGQRCENPDGCDVSDYDDLSLDHFTPICIGLLQGWSFEELNNLWNLQLLCKPHHDAKDSSTNQRYRRLIRQFKGEIINEHQKIIMDIKKYADSITEDHF